jgi:predicted TIM-barrel fold metal-dependent hydrolase
MLTRRDALAGALAAGALTDTRRGFARASQPATPVDFEVPPDACDCHTHIIGDPANFPLWPGRTYTPETAAPEEMAALHRALHIRRVVIVTPSVYGSDNSATLYGMKVRDANARGIAVIDVRTPDGDLDRLSKAGVRGIRLNLMTGGQPEPEAIRQRFREAAKRIEARAWHIQIYIGVDGVSALKELVLAAPMPVVFDHFGGAQAADGIDQPGFGDLLELLRSGRAYVKISAAYRSSTNSPDYADVAPLAKALIAANAERVLWGTDWPHTDSAAHPGHGPGEVSPLLAIDDGRLLNQLARWAPNAAVRKKILVDNPARLYGF